MLGRTVSHYRIVSRLGAGGMGVVYGAEDIRLGRPVALKFVHDELAHDRHAMDRFQFEARAASALNHQNICTIYDIGEDDGHPFIVMELMKGQTLRDRLAAGPLKTHQIVDIGIQVADALDGAHGHGIIHRDVKPANIFLTDRGQAKVLDFGLAKLSLRQAGLNASSTTAPAPDQLTVAPVTMGTVAYMSPEQVAGDELDGRTDLFSLGVVLYECATGHRPFTGNTSAVVLAAILNQAPVAPVVFKPDLPLRLQVIINNCLEKDRELRYQTAADVRADLKRARRDLESGHSGAVRRVGGPLIDLNGQGDDGAGVAPTVGQQAPVAIAAEVASGGPLSTTPPRRGRRWVIGAAVVAVALTGSSYWLWQRPVVPTETALAPATAGRATPQASPPEARPGEPIGGPSGGRPAPSAGPPKGSAPVPRLPSQRAPVPRVPPSAPPAEGAADAIPSRTLPEVTASPPDSPPSPPPAIPPVQPPASPRDVTPAPPSAAVSPERRDRDAFPAAPSPAEEDEAAIRKVVAAYARAIETKDLSLFRSVKPNLSREEERRLAEGFRAVSLQQVSLTILAIDRRGPEATVRLRRRDAVEAGGRKQTAETDQSLTLARTGSGWVIVEIGR